MFILGDGRMNNLGHSAQYSSYSFMENNSKRMLCIVTLEKRATDKKAPIWRRCASWRDWNSYLKKKMKVVEVVTNAHVEVASIMSKTFFSHSYWNKNHQ